MSADYCQEGSFGLKIMAAKITQDFGLLCGIRESPLSVQCNLSIPEEEK
ncbi:MAG: hypothetical protein J5855_00035 [Mailhella sp.]|nr:hypothetical protein [Mailhella sp.]